MGKVSWFNYLRHFSEREVGLLIGMIGSRYREPDLIISDEHENPYLYRWWVIPRNREANVYAHIQVASDPARPLHDHPWDNTSVILAGGYIEYLSKWPEFDNVGKRYERKPGDVIFRSAQEAHRLVLPKSVKATMTLFSTGPNVQEWGFYTEAAKKTVHHNWTAMVGNASLWTGPKVKVDDEDFVY